jgi:integrase
MRTSEAEGGLRAMTEGAIMEVKFRYLIADIDRNGNTRRYVRKPKCAKIRLRSKFGTPEFVQEYLAAMSGTPNVAIRKPASLKSEEGSLEWLVNRYYASTTFGELGEETQKVRRRILDSACDRNGTKLFGEIRATHIRLRMDELADRPEAANGYLKALRGLFKFAVEREYLTADPSAGIKKVRHKTEGFHTWTIEEVRQYEATHHIGTKARLALALLLYTGQRRGDVVRMGRQHVENGLLRVVQGKTREALQLPVLPVLAHIIAQSPTGDMTFLVTQWGKPFSPAGFGNLFREWCDKAGLQHCTAHGLRKAGATIAAENGATDRQLMAMFGWKNAAQATVYTRKSDNKRLAASGVPLLTMERKT